MNELLTMAKKAKENAEALRTRSKALQEQRYKTFQTTLASLDDIEAFEIAPSHGIGSAPCVVITDKANRKFEIHYHPSSLTNSDYRICAQWKKETWYSPSVFMNKFKVAEILGRWLAETQTITDSLECK